LPALATDLVRRHVTIIATAANPPAALTAKAATTTIPLSSCSASLGWQTDPLPHFPLPTLSAMSDATENLVLEHLRAIPEELRLLRDDVSELKTTQAGMLQILASHETHLVRIDTRLDRIERRLEPSDTPAS
jgi:hypothetical protein